MQTNIPPGELISVGDHRLHIHCTGRGGPAVVLEAGVAASSVSWTGLQRQLSEFTTVCSYDRAGLGWSDLARTPRTPDAMVSELHVLLNEAKLQPPYVLVGHSFGGLLARLFADLYPDDVLALVLLDPAHVGEWARPRPEDLRRLRRGIQLSRRGAWLARIGFVRLSLNLLAGGRRTLPKLMAKASGGGRGSGVTERLVGEVRKLPPEAWPVVQEHWSRPESFLGMASHLEALPAVAAAAEGLHFPRTTVISKASQPASGLAEHRSLGRHIVAERSGHWVHLDEPELVTAIVREIVEAHLASIGHGR